MPENLKVGDRVEYELYKVGGQKGFGVVTRILPAGPLIAPDAAIGAGVRMFNIKKAGSK